MMEILLHTHPCYPIDASVSRGYAGIFYAHTCSVPARRPCRNIATPTWKGRVSPQPNCTHNRAQWNVWPAPSIYLSTGCFNFGERYRPTRAPSPRPGLSSSPRPARPPAHSPTPDRLRTRRSSLPPPHGSGIPQLSAVAARALCSGPGHPRSPPRLPLWGGQPPRQSLWAQFGRRAAPPPLPPPPSQRRPLRLEHGGKLFRGHFGGRSL